MKMVREQSSYYSKMKAGYKGGSNVYWLFLNKNNLTATARTHPVGCDNGDQLCNLETWESKIYMGSPNFHPEMQRN